MNREELKRISEKAKKNKGINDALQGFVHDFSTRQVLGETKIHQVEQTVDRTVVELQQTHGEVREYQQKVEECHHLIKQMQSEMLGMQEKMKSLEKKNFINENINRKVDIRLHRLDDFNKKFDARLHSLCTETKEHTFSRLLGDFTNENSIDNSRTIENLECALRPTLYKERDSKSPENIYQDDNEILDDEKTNEKSEDECTKEQTSGDNSDENDEKSENAREKTTDEKSSEKSEDESSPPDNNIHSEEVLISQNITLQPEGTTAPHDIPSTSLNNISDDSTIENNDEKLKLQKISEHERSFLTSESGPSVIKKCNNSLASVLKTRKNIENRSLARTTPEPKTMVNLRKQRAELKALAEKSSPSTETCSTPESPLETIVLVNDAENLSFTVPESCDRLDAQFSQPSTFITESSEEAEIKEKPLSTPAIDTYDVLNVKIERPTTLKLLRTTASEIHESNSIIPHQECRVNLEEKVPEIPTVSELESYLDLTTGVFDEKEVEILNSSALEESLVPKFEKAELLLIKSYVDPSLNIGSRSSIGIILESFRVEPVEERKAYLTYVPLFNKPTVSIAEIFLEAPTSDMMKRIKFRYKHSVKTKIQTLDFPRLVSDSKLANIDLPELKPCSLLKLKETISKELEEFELSDSNELDIPISDISGTSIKDENTEKTAKKRKKKKKKKKNTSSEENQIQDNKEVENDSMKLKVFVGSENLIESEELNGELCVIDDKEGRQYVLDITGSLQVDSEISVKEKAINHIPQEILYISQLESTSSMYEKSKKEFDPYNEATKLDIIDETVEEYLSESYINDESQNENNMQETLVIDGSDEVDVSESVKFELDIDNVVENNESTISINTRSEDLTPLELTNVQTKSKNILFEATHLGKEKSSNLDIKSSSYELEKSSKTDNIKDVFSKIIGESEFSFTYIPEVVTTDTSETTLICSSEMINLDNTNLLNNRTVAVEMLEDHNCEFEEFHKNIEFMTPFEETSELIDSHSDGDYMTPLQDYDETIDSHEDCDFMTPVQDISEMIISQENCEYMPPLPEAYTPADYHSEEYYQPEIHYELYPQSYSSVYFGDWNSYTLEYSDEAYGFTDEYENNENVTNDFCAVEQGTVNMEYNENEEYVTYSDECQDKATSTLTEEITSIVEIKNTQKDVRFVAELEREMITQALEPNVDQLGLEVKKYSYPIDTCEDSEDEKQVEKKDAESQADKSAFDDAQNASNDIERLNEIIPSKLPYSISDPLKSNSSLIDINSQLKKDIFTQTSELDDLENDDNITIQFCPHGEELADEEDSLYLPTAEGASSMDVENKMGGVEELGTCANCSESAKLRCGNCRQSFYCKRECQRDHWKKGHKDQCRPYKVMSSNELGRYMVATRDLKAGDIILKEDPIVVGPKQHTEPICLGCYKRVDGSYRCEICSWPLCGPECAKSPDHQPECVIGKEIGSPIQVNDFNSTNHFYEVVMPIRCLALKKRSPKKYEQYKSLESHLEDRKGTFTYSENQKNVVEMLRGYFMLLTFDPEEIDNSERGIHTALGICDTNALDINLQESTIQGLYPNFAMLEHSCTPNTKHTYINGRKVILKAAVDIKQGEHLSTMYTHVLWGTYARREHLKHNKYFMCQCPRCSDPTELGTHFSALRCPRCPPGFLLPAAPLDELADWICSACNFTMPADDARAVTVGLGAAVEQTLMQPSTDLLEAIIEKNAKDIVHPNHFHLFVIRHTLLQMYGRDPTTQDDESMQKKEKLCQDFLKICTALDPGMARLAPFAGVALYEYHLAVLSRARGVGSAQQVDQTILKKDLETAESLLQQCIKVLADEPEDQPEGQLYKVAQQNLLELKQWEATVIESQS